MDAFIDPYADSDSLGMDGFINREQPFSLQPTSEPRAVTSPSSMLGLAPRMQGGDISSSAAGWALRSSSPGLPARKTSVDSFLDIRDHATSISQSMMLQGISPVSMGLADAGFDTLRQPSPGDNWLRKSSPGDPWASQQQNRPQPFAGDVLRNQHHEPDASRSTDIQQLVPSSQGLSQPHWLQQGTQQQQQQQQQQSHAQQKQQQQQSQLPQQGMVPLGAGVTNVVPVPTASRPMPVAPTAVETEAQLSRQRLTSSALQDKQHQRQQQPAEEMETDEEYGKLMKHQQRQQQPDMDQSFRQQQQGSLPGSGSDLAQPEKLSSWPFNQPGLQHQQQQDTPAGSHAAPAVAAGATSKKKSSKSSGGSKKPAAAAATAAAAAEGDFSGLWKPPPQPKEAKVPKEPGVDYEDIIPQGLDATNTRPLPIPTDMLELQDLTRILNLDTWTSVLDESDRAQLRVLLPNNRSGFSESVGYEGLGLEALLSGAVNFHFGNPTAKFWGDVSSGTANPRLRRQQEMAIQLRQQLAAAQLRIYHNTQVSTLLQMQRLWATQMPAEATTAERLAVWKSAQQGELGMPQLPAAAAKDGDDMDDVEEAADDAEGDEAAVEGGRPAGFAAGGVAGNAAHPGDSSGARAAAVAMQQVHVVAAGPAAVAMAARTGSPAGALLATVLGQSSSVLPPVAAAAVADDDDDDDNGGVAGWPVQEPQLGKRSASIGVATAVAAATAAAGIRPSAAAGGAAGVNTARQSPPAAVEATDGVLPGVQFNAAAALPASLGGTLPGAKPSMAPKPQATKVSQKAAAPGKVYPSISASRQNVYVYEGPVDFSKNMTKRQAAAAAAAAAKQQGGDQQSGGDMGSGQEGMDMD